MIGKAIGAVFGAYIALGVLMPFMQKNMHAVVNGPLPTTAEQQATTRVAKNVFDCQVVFHRDSSFASDNAGLKKVELFTTVHLAIDELERGGLALRLTIGPGRRNGGANDGLVLGNAVSE